MSEYRTNIKKASGQGQSFRKSVSGSRTQRLLAILIRLRPLQVFSALLQIFFGLLMTGVALFGTLRPLWLAASISVFSCILAMVGTYQLYDMLSTASNSGKLVDDAIRNSIEFRN